MSKIGECVEKAEVVNIPTYKELAELPPADTMPVVAVYDKSFVLLEKILQIRKVMKMPQQVFNPCCLLESYWKVGLLVMMLTLKVVEEAQDI